MHQRMFQATIAIVCGGLIGSAISLQSSRVAAEEHATAKKVATFGGGCFWCTEAIFQQLVGVEQVVPGFSGGKVKNPTYQQVLTKKTGHAEVIQITYDPKKITFAELLEVFWKTHDPTTRKGQGIDVGPQYRSVVFYHDDEQRQAAEHYKNKLNKAGAFDRPIVTQIVRLTNFYPADSNHQNYFQTNPDDEYCILYVRPKVEKFRAVFADKLKPEFTGAQP